MRYIPQKTLIGELYGRDAIYLDTVVVSDCCNTLELAGEFNCTLATIPQQAKWHRFCIRFSGVVALQVSELDAWCVSVKGEWPLSSFDEVEESSWKASFAGATSLVINEHRHYCFATYDRVFDV